MSRDEIVALDVLNAARLSAEFAQGINHEAFKNDLKTQSAVLHQLLIVGEAVKRLSNSFRSEHPELPWKLMAGMRDQLIHNYDSIDVELVWETLQKDVPEVISVLSLLLEDVS